MSQTIAATTSSTKVKKIGLEIFISCVGSVFLALLSQLAIPLPFTPIPMTLQTFGLFVLAGTLGGKRAFYSVLAYLAQGTLGLPVFAGGIVAQAWFLTAKGGFLISFPIAAFTMGKMMEKRQSLLGILFSLTVGQIIIFTLGMLWLSFFMGISNAFLLGVVPFLPSIIAKTAIATPALKGYFTLNSKKVQQ